MHLHPAFAHDPHALLGLHPLAAGGRVIRLFRPQAESLHIELFGTIASLRRVDPYGLFEIEVPQETTPLDYRVFHTSGLLAHDPYAFLPTFGEVDAYLFNQGVHYRLYEVMGARCALHQGVRGVKFAVWAPSAVALALVADFNHWDGRVQPMRSMGESGVWELFVPGIGPGEKYKFEIRTQEGELRVKADPYALWSEGRPKTASLVFDIEGYPWSDGRWMGERGRQEQRPMHIYEVHLGSWKRRGEELLNYRELAEALAPYCREMGFTHVELLPIAEHPLDESWGYQVSGYYAPSSRYGSPSDFQYFVDHLHGAGIGVILDWVASHFPADDFALARFDGSALYEHEDPRLGMHPHWQSCIFNYGRREVSNFLIANVLFWCAKMHIDGLRVDAVASMLYRDYGREEGEWLPNAYGGRENLEAIELLRHLNAVVHEQHPGVMMIAEESSAYPGVTHALEWGGLGFDFKWNMGWMHDTLRYFGKDPLYRSYHHSDLTFGLLYAFSERFLLVLSHDEVVHGKRSLLSKMPGDAWQRFAQLRLLYSYYICQPGKKLLFMGGELGQWHEWNCKEELPWFLLQEEPHRGVHAMVRALNHLYLASPPLWEQDSEPRGFEWVDFSDQQNSVVSYLRKGHVGGHMGGQMSALLCIHNFTPAFFESYEVRLQGVRGLSERFNSDGEEYGGSGKLCREARCSSGGVSISLAPLATQIFEVHF